MKQGYERLTDAEKLKVENDFLKMKMMLERGAAFGNSQSGKELPPEMENEFLKNIMLLEEQQDSRELVTVFERIGQPAHFKPAADLDDEEIEEAWQEINMLLNENGISLDCCSPNVTARELYRFTIEELFRHEIDKVALPGWMCCFIYDEFHPDPVYENTTAALETCRQIFAGEPMEWMHHFKKENLRLNDHYPITEEEFKNAVNRFKQAYDKIELLELQDKFCSISESIGFVKGDYKVQATINNDIVLLSGNWAIRFELNEEFGYWFINEVEVGGNMF